MGAFSGHGGNVTFGSGYTVNVYSWSIDYTAEALESTDFASSGARTFIPGLTGWSGSYECRLDSATPIVAPGAAAASATFQARTGLTYNGNIIITGVSPANAVDGLSGVTFSFQGTAGLSITAPGSTTTTSTTSTTETTAAP